jgi:hypothetical protein
MRLPNGAIVELPHAPDLAEFQLPGNVETYPGIVALYDESTLTSAMYVLAERQWLLRQPVTRDAHAHACRLYSEIIPGARTAMAEIAAAASGPAN